MKKLLLTFAACVCGTISAYSVPACPIPEQVEQPDGTVLSVQLHGDEFLNYSTTSDGYTVVKNTEGFYVYAIENAGKLIPSTRIAHDLQNRESDEIAYLSTVEKHLRPVETSASAQMRDIRKSFSAHPLLHNEGKYDIKNFRGLVILVEYNDRKFIRDDAHDFFNKLINQKNYDGYMTTAQIPEKVECTGSVKDYYYDNSMGQFDPEFDVVGPVTIDYSQYSAGGSTNGQILAMAACKAADDLVDFSKYDRNGDNKVDMVFFIFAGHGANYSGNDSRLLWPHASRITTQRLDNVFLGRYACSTELYGRQTTEILDGIGTMCHEFSHVLGLPDEYDTDYEKSGGQSVHPERWSIMAGGSYLNKSRTPAGYTLYERYALGFANPEKIEKGGDFTLEALGTSNSGYRIDSPINNEYFLFENRQKTKWDSYLLGHGMLVFRVDSTNVDVWENNKINCNPAHNYLELLRANPNVASSGSVTDSEGDPFPGSGKVTIIDNNTTPNLRSWTGTSSPLIISDITEAADGTISFSVKDDSTPTLYEDFESMSLTDNDVEDLQGKFCKWSLSAGARIASVADGNGKGSKAVAMVRKSEICTSVIEHKVNTISFDIYNPTSSGSIFRCYYSTDEGSSWVAMTSVDGISNISITGGSHQRITYATTVENPMFRIMEYTGSSTNHCFIDDVKIMYDKEESGVAGIASDSETFTVKCTGNELVVTTGKGSPIRVYNANGTIVAETNPENGEARISLSQRGFYIVAQESASVKVIY